MAVGPMSAKVIGHHIRTRWAAGTLAAGWTYQGAGYWGTPAPRRPSRTRMLELATELAEKFPELSFTENLCRVWCWGSAPIIVEHSPHD